MVGSFVRSLLEKWGGLGGLGHCKIYGTHSTVKINCFLLFLFIASCFFVLLCSFRLLALFFGSKYCNILVSLVRVSKCKGKFILIFFNEFWKKNRAELIGICVFIVKRYSKFPSN